MEKIIHWVHWLPNIFHHLKIRTKLFVFSVIPLASLLIIGMSSNYEYYEHLVHAKQSRHAIDLSIELELLIRELQKERGLTEGYIAVKGQHYQELLNKTRLTTDTKVIIFIELLGYFKITHHDSSYAINIAHSIKNIRFKLDLLSTWRLAADNLKPKDYFNYYSAIITNILELVQQIQIPSQNISQTRLYNNYISLLWLEEKSDLERGSLNRVLTAENLDSNKLQQVFSYAVSQDRIIQEFLTTANTHHQQFLTDVIGSPYNQEILKVRAWYQKVIAANNVMGDVQNILGYGGLIHHFKNFILRGEEKHIALFNHSLEQLQANMLKFKQQSSVTSDELHQLNIIINTINRYSDALKLAQLKYKQGLAVSAIDQLVSIDDTAAIESLLKLKSNKRWITNQQWLQLSTSRIDALQIISGHLIEDMLEQAALSEKEAIRKLLLNLMLLVTTFLVSVYIGYLLINRLVHDVEAIAGAIGYMENEQDFNKPLPVYGRDELSQMAIAFNKMLQQREQYEGQSIVSAAVFEHASEAIMITNAANVIEIVNPAFTQISGYKEEEVVGKTPDFLQSDHHDDKFHQDMWQSLHDNGAWQGEIWNKRKNGEIYPEFLAISVVKDSYDKVVQYISLFTDITKHKEFEQDIWHQANFDQLTGLANRNLCLDRLRYEIKMGQRSNKKLALMFIDLDRFKYVNDTLGHDSGDELLKFAAIRLKECLRKTDTVARFGGDEFVIILPDIKSKYDPERIAETIIASLSAPFCLNQKHEAVVSASIGITLYPADAHSEMELLKNADTAMYQAKDNGRNTFSFFTSQMNKKVTERMKLELELRKAIERNEFVLHYQPVVALAEDQIIGVEALIRWQHPRRGLIYPDDFITLAEETGLIEGIGKWVIQQAIIDLKALHNLGYKLHVAVNISGRQCHRNCQKPISEIISKVLAVYDLDPSYLKIEITESLLMDNSQQMIDTLQGIRDLGVAIHMDDFGTGYSSLSYLKRFPIDVLKIDRSFISGAIEDQVDARLVTAVVLIGHSLKLKLVGEGIETLQHYNYLEQLGCDYGQGYFISRPLAYDKLVDFMVKKQPLVMAPLSTKTS